DDLQLQDGDSLQSPVQDALSVLDSTARMLFVYITDSLNIHEQTGSQLDEAEELEVERDDDRVGSGKQDRKVYDSSHFIDRPLSRTVITSIDITDPQGNVRVQLESGENVVLSVGVRNYQSVRQGYAMFVQITDVDDVAVKIIEVSGSIDDGEYTKVDAHWITEQGTLSVKVFVCDDAIHPTVISESFVKTVVVN
ncbi:MAG TPA: hypothetical protein VI338_01790, partial [Nitrososphaera sp.]|nr:hypothetical protein [Nitrososphaera sp.]